MQFAAINSGLMNAAPYYRSVNPNLISLLSVRVHQRTAKLAIAGCKAILAIRQYRQHDNATEAIGEFVGWYAVKKIKSPIRKLTGRGHLVASRTNHDLFRRNGMGGRGWYDTPKREKLVVVFHDANRAGPHIDVHIGRVSLVYRVKDPVYQQLRYNRHGELTEASRKLLLDHIRSEIQNHSRVAQNIDHSRSNAVATWYDGSKEDKHYGAGVTRQVILSSEVDIYKAHWNGPMEMYAPAINPHRPLYLYRLYNDANTSRAPICIWGAKTATHPQLLDRLHLKMIDPNQVEQHAHKMDLSTSTLKYDGSSAYVVITPKGTTVWSPRISKVTGDRIEYTPKLDGLAQTTSDQTIVAMGEVLFKEKSFNPLKKDVYLPSATGSGILNSNEVLPKHIQPEIRLYRVDKIGRKDVSGLSFSENRALQTRVAKLSPMLDVVKYMKPQDTHRHGHEGYVVVPPDGNVNNGYKIKWIDDPEDWRIDQVDFKFGEKEGMAGVIHATNLSNGRSYKLGPGQVGTRELTEHMMHNPQLYEGSVIKVTSRRGHSGRASKVVGFHDDKGLAPF